MVLEFKFLTILRHFRINRNIIYWIPVFSLIFFFDILLLDRCLRNNLILYRRRYFYIKIRFIFTISLLAIAHHLLDGIFFRRTFKNRLISWLIVFNRTINSVHTQQYSSSSLELAYMRSVYKSS